MNVFELFAKLSLDSSEYEKGLDDAKSAGSGFGSALATSARVGLTAVTAVGTAVAVAGTRFVDGASDVAQYGDTIDKMSQKLGISAEAYQEWDAVMQHSGASIESLQPAMKTLATQAQTGNEAFQQLGISEEEVASLSQEDLFSRVIAGLQGMEEGTERTYIATQLLGRGSTELGALLNTSAEETQAMRDRVHELGGVMSDEAVKASADFQDQLQDMQTSFAGLKRGMMGNFLPALTTVMSGLTEVFSGNYDQGLDQISEGIDQVISNISDMMPRLIEIGGRIIESLAEAIITNLPKLLPALVNVVMNIANMLIENLPLLIETGMQVILQIAMGIAEALPDLMPTIVDVIITIVETLIDNVDLLIEASIALILGLAEGLINALPRLLARIPEIIVKIVETLIRNVPKLNESAREIILGLAKGILSFISKMGEVALDLIVALAQGIVDLKDRIFDSAVNIMENFKDGILGFVDSAKTWGHDLINNFIGGIKDKINDVVNTCKDIANTIADYLGFSEPEKGALSNFHTFAPDMIDLFTSGLEAGKAQLEDTLNDVISMPVVDAKDNMAYNQSSGSAGSADMMSMITNALSGMIVQVNIGNEALDGMISKSIQRTAYVSGGR